MDVFNRPPTIAEDTVQYTLYPPRNLDDKISATTFAASIKSHVNTLIPNLIWHRDAFELKVVSDADPENHGWVLEGRMRVGDSVDDEWLTVWLLREISTKWDLVISVFDSDGEFLLIEAAESLPSWVKPTNTENRVWIYKSHLHLIAISHASPPREKYYRRRLRDTSDEGDNDIEDVDNFIAIQHAIKLVRDSDIETIAPPAVEETLWQRISQYPDAARYHMHTTKAFVPSDIALALARNPSLIQKAVEAFYTRDAIQLRAAHRMSRFSLNSSVLSTVKMTRTAYAQLVGQRFFPPKVFGHWSELEGTKEWKWRDTGMKIAVGFEMLYQESKVRSDTSPETVQSSTEARKDALRRNPEYKTFIDNLISANYFKGEIEGSQLWGSLESQAADMFVEAHREDDATRSSFAAQVNEAILGLAEPGFLPQDDEDSDDWLNINAQDFESQLGQTFKKSRGNGQADAMDVDSQNDGETDAERLASLQAAKLKSLAEKVETFVQGEGELEGVRFDDDTFSDEFSDDGLESDSEEDHVNMSIERADMDKLVPGLDPADYGKMPPSFYSNSQRVAHMGHEVGAADRAKESSEGKASTSGAKPIRPPIITRNKYDGVDSDDESDENEVDDDDESEEEHPQIVGDVEIDMEEEEEEFLEFSRQALGISDDQWKDIVRDRQMRGAFLPASVISKGKSATTTLTMPTETAKEQVPEKSPKSSSQSGMDTKLESFEAVMQAMDAELARVRPKYRKATSISISETNRKGKGKDEVLTEDPDEDIESAMDAELKAALEREEDSENETRDEEPPDYTLIKNFLESFKSQAGLSGPVSNLAGMLEPGWRLPRDNS